MSSPNIRAAKFAWLRLPSAWLLGLQLLILVTAPIFESYQADTFSNSLSAIALLLVANIIRKSPVFNSIGFLLVAGALILSSLATWGGMIQLTPWANIVEAAAYFYAGVGMVLYMLEDHNVTTDELFAAAAVFTLFVWGFAYVYSACQIFRPHTFTAAINTDDPRTWPELLFYSFTVLSSTGLGDIVPITSTARVITALEMFTGVMYMALVVSRLVGMVQRKN